MTFQQISTAAQTCAGYAAAAGWANNGTYGCPSPSQLPWP